MKKCTWKKYTASVLVAAMLAAQPMAVYADEASTASQAAYSDTEAKDINGVYERVSDKVAGMLANGELTYSETSGYLYNASGSKVDPETGAEIPDTTETETKAPETETKASDTETKAPETETKAPETSASETETESQTGTGESENPRQRQQILKPVQQRQKQQRQDPKQNQNLSRRLRHRRQRHLGLHQIMLRHRQIQKQRSLRQLQRQAAILSRMFPTRHPVFSRRSVIEYSIM